MATNTKNSTAEETAKKAPAKNGKQEESNGGLMAVIIALVAIIIIAGSVGAFFLFVKLKKDYFTPKDTTTSIPGPEIANTPENIPAETISGGIGNSAPETPPVVPVTPTTPTTPTIPETPTTPDVPEVPEVPEPDKVGSYDFDETIAGLDSTMNETYDTTFNNSVYSNDYFGF